ncbi:hypothetical protein GCM10011512_26590 [Tersicoccus solisilvae]|uniref:DUF559 domain-containing protein n=1 Tax=Tersicoccus solisilvae TaxID=1882339 RepID=A0ABQ1PJX5_9MICC|nr:type IV toxin-antitoxin system AbiEi family antitoxin domain-containing protein [Tersicoccus solisilvae]GGC98318.1 hypothetical protein GCM10011512_26590 [Tersicoccus solisilvae]
MRAFSPRPTGHELGVRTTGQLLHAGYGSNRLDRLVRTGALIRIWRGHYVAATTWNALTPEDKQLARLFCSQAVPTGSERVLCRQSSALAHGLSLLRLDSSIHVVARTKRATGERHAGLRFHLTEEETPVVALPHGLLVTTATATLIDCARFLPHRDALVIADQFAAAGVDPDRVAAWATSHPGWRGVARLRLVLERVDPLSESAGETLTRIRLHEWAVPLPVSQFEIETPLGLFRADFAWPELMLILEFDGKAKYFGETPTAEVLFKERQREKALAALGWTVLRTDWDEVNRRPEALRARLTSALARGRRGALRA